MGLLRRTECFDDATDSRYYFNTWSQETRWKMPFEMVLAKALRVRVCVVYVCVCVLCVFV
jgi:hypothetical protein